MFNLFEPIFQFQIFSYINQQRNRKLMQSSKSIVLLLVITAIFINQSVGLPQGDKVTGAPGFINQTLYSGYLKTMNESRQIHYVYVAAQQNVSAKPLTFWFNGGPGCSSLIGLIQQIGPYLVGNKYNHGESLIRNNYAWNKISNLVFLESPAGVGFSTNKEQVFNYTDKQTAEDAFAAIKDFLFSKADQFKNFDLFLAGQSYAGKYIPDLADLIMKHNSNDQNPYIHLKGILVGNGVIDFEDNVLDKAQLEFLATHSFIDLRLFDIYQQSCARDWSSPRCKYIQSEFKAIRKTINVYNAFQVCSDGTATEAMQLQKMLGLKRQKEMLQQYDQLTESQANQLKNPKNQQIAQCQSDDGAISYWNEYKINYHVEKSGKTWAPCYNINYDLSLKGSMGQYERIFLNKDIKVWLYSGDWDDQVPITDTDHNLQKLGKNIHKKWEPWFVDGIHAGFVHEEGDYFSLVSVKTAGHMVPQDRPKQAYQMFYNFVHNKPVNSTVPWW